MSRRNSWLTVGLAALGFAVLFTWFVQPRDEAQSDAPAPAQTRSRADSPPDPSGPPGSPGPSHERLEPLSVDEPVRTRESVAGAQRVTILPSPAPSTITGRVVDDTGKPVDQAWLQAGPPVFDAAPGSQVPAVPMQRARSNSSGRFELVGLPAGLPIEVLAEDSEHVSAVSTTAKVGDTNVLLVLPRGGRIGGTMLLDDGVPPLGLTISLSAEDAQARGAEGTLLGTATWDMQSARKATGAVRVDMGADLSFAFRGVKPGKYTVRTLLAYDGRLLSEIRGIVSNAGETTDDPRLNPVDLRRIVRAFPIRVFDENRAAVNAGFASWTTPPATGPAPKVVFTGGRFFVITDQPMVDLDVGAAGFRTVHVAGVDGPREVILGAGVTVHVLLRGATVPAAPRKLRVVLAPEPKPGEPSRELGPNAHLVLSLEGLDAASLEKVRAAHTCSYFDGVDLDPEGRATLYLPQSGRYQVHWYTSSIPLEDGLVTVDQVRVSARRVEIQGGVPEITLELDLDPAAIPPAQYPR